MTTLATLLTDFVDADPDTVATVDVADGQLIRTSRRELAHRVRALSAELKEVGLTRGQCVAVMLPNWSDTIVWQFAATALGAHVIGVNTRYNTREVFHILESAHPCVVAVADRFHGLDLYTTLSEAATSSEPSTVPAVAVVGGPGVSTTPPDPRDFDLGAGAWIAGSADTSGVRVPATEDMASYTDSGIAMNSSDPLAVAFTTSGSTGTPKLAAHREGAVVGHAHADAVALDIVPGDVVLCVLPVSGVFGFSTAMAGLAGGAVLYMEPVFDATATLTRMEALSVTHIVGGDDLYGRLHDQWQISGGDLSSLKRLGIADFLGRTAEIATWARDRFDASTTGVFGSSEIFALMLLWNSNDAEKLRWTGGGRPVSTTIEVRVTDPFDDSVLPNGQQGELQVRGPNVVDAYLGNPEAAAAAFTADGWFRSGDLGTATGDGGYSYVCRMGDVLRLRGFLVDPAEIEQRLAEHPAVGLAKVVGITGDGGYTRAVAFVVPTATGDVDAAGLKAWCASALASFKVPTAVHFIDSMPTTVGGNGTKIRAVELREWAAQWTDHERDFRA